MQIERVYDSSTIDHIAQRSHPTEVLMVGNIFAHMSSGQNYMLGSFPIGFEDFSFPGSITNGVSVQGCPQSVMKVLCNLAKAKTKQRLNQYYTIILSVTHIMKSASGGAEWLRLRLLVEPYSRTFQENAVSEKTKGKAGRTLPWHQRSENALLCKVLEPCDGNGVVIS